MEGRMDYSGHNEMVSTSPFIACSRVYLLEVGR